MTYLDTVGVDVSKRTIDVTIFSAELHRQFNNDSKGFNQLLKWVKKSIMTEIDKVLFCCEHTGMYSLEFSLFCHQNNLSLVMESGLRIKKSQGLQRGKNDQIDSKMIAEYAFEKKHKLRLYSLPSAKLLNLKRLLTLRKHLVRTRTGHKVSLKECKYVLRKKDNQTLFSCHEKMINYITKQVQKVEQDILQLINSDEVLRKQYILITSIKGIGFVIAVTLIVYTGAFSKFDTWRQFSCYIGTAPFAVQSGSSLKSKGRLHSWGHRELKSIIHLGASSSIISNPEMKKYYQERVAQGKSKMSTLNIIRNKLLARIFAVVKRGTPYIETHGYAA